MNEPWIVDAKITPPAAPPGWLRRDALWEAPASVNVLAAGPGYGKTLAALAFAERTIEAGGAVVWYSLEAEDAEPSTFFWHALAGVRRHIPHFGQDLEAMLAAGASEPRKLWMRLCQEIAAYNLPAFAWVLDDFHLIEGAGPMASAIAGSLDKLPTGLTLVITTRRRLPVPLGKLQLAGKVRVLDQGRLRFDEAERERLFGLRGQEATREVPPEIEGWPLGLVHWAAMAQPLDAGLDAYLGEEFFSRQPAERQTFLLRSCLLEPLTIAACESALGLTAAREHLAALEADHHVQRLADGLSFRYPAHLRAFLSAEAARTQPREQLEAWHVAIARACEERQQHERALSHWVAAQAWPSALDCARRIFPGLAVRGQHAVIERWIRSFPEPTVQAEPWLQLWIGHQRARHGAHADAQEHYARARRLFLARGEAAGELKALVRECGIALLTDDARFESLLETGLERLAAAAPEDLADLGLIRALDAERRGDGAGVEAHNLSVLAVETGDSVEVATCKGIALLNLFTLAFGQGDLVRAHRHIAEAIELAETWQFLPVRLFAEFMQAHLHLQEGEVEAAGAFLRRLPPHWEDLLDWHDLGCALSVVGDYHRAKQHWKEAESALRRALIVFEKAGFAAGKKVPLERLMWLALQRGQLTRLEVLLETAGERGEPSIHDLALQVPLVRAFDLSGRTDEAIALVERVVPALDRLGARLYATQARLIEATARARAGDAQGSRQVLATALATIQAHQYDFLLDADPELRAELAIAPAPAEKLSVHCFGGMEVLLGDRPIWQWPRRKAKLMLAALVLHRRGLTVTELAEMLADGTSGSNLVHTVEVSLSALRQALEPGAKDGATRLLTRRGDRYVLDEAAIASCDVWRFEDGITAANAARQSDPERAVALWREAIAHLRGNLLEESFFLPYFEAERERLRKWAIGALRGIAAHAQSRGDAPAAEQALARALELSPCDESLALLLMTHHRDQGQLERARQVYWDCRRALKSQLGLSPSEAFEAKSREFRGVTTQT